MGPDSSLSSGDTQQPPAARQKRSRVLLSCGPCRGSKLKCDRESPCSQCQKKGREDLCQYAPKPEKRKPPKTMSARLKRLEGMVRGMMDADGNVIPQGGEQQTQGEGATGAAPQVTGQMVRGQNGTTYIGATHCMAMLEDIEDLKCYFDEPEENEDADTPLDQMDSPEMLLFSQGGAPRNRDELLAQLPEKNVVDRLITRYFSSMSPSQHTIHQATFTRTYSRFWQDPDSVHFHWIAQLFMILSVGTHFNAFVAPQEVQGDSPMAPADRVKHYRTCAGWALAWGKYTQPTFATLPAFLLYVESDFMFSRAAQMNCYILSGVLIRLMLKMGLHRDPAKLANISPFEGEMRRRMWNMAIQIETLASFHMGLPSMMQSIEADTAVPLNLKDEDFDEDIKELPPPRPISDWTNMTYPIHKTNILRVFGEIARQTHSLTPPSYSEVLRLDNILQETWKSVPTFMMVRPLEECVGVSPQLLIQRFGLAALYNKSRCVLHRRYLAEAMPKREHDYSRKQCLQGAMTLLTNQNIIWEACRPGNVLSQNGWFISSLAVHDYLLGAMVLYLVIQNEHYGDVSNDHYWNQQGPAPTKGELTNMIRRSHEIWSHVAQGTTEVRRTADTLGVMLSRLGGYQDDGPAQSPAPQTLDSSKNSSGSSVMPESSVGTLSSARDQLSSFELDGSASGTGLTPFSAAQTTDTMDSVGFPGMEPADHMSSNMNFDHSWVTMGNNMDWRYLDINLAHSHSGAHNLNGPGPVWTERAPLDDMDMMNFDFWGAAADPSATSK